jgi:hypothetical protein
MKGSGYAEIDRTEMKLEKKRGAMTFEMRRSRMVVDNNRKI